MVARFTKTTLTGEYGRKKLYSPPRFKTKNRERDRKKKWVPMDWVTSVTELRSKYRKKITSFGNG